MANAQKPTRPPPPPSDPEARALADLRVEVRVGPVTVVTNGFQERRLWLDPAGLCPARAKDLGAAVAAAFNASIIEAEVEGALASARVRGQNFEVPPDGELDEHDLRDVILAGDFCYALRLLFQERGLEVETVDSPLRPETLAALISGRCLPSHSDTQFTIAALLGPVLDIEPQTLLALAEVIQEEWQERIDDPMEESSRDGQNSTWMHHYSRSIRWIPGRLPVGVGLGNLRASGIIPQAIQDLAVRGRDSALARLSAQELDGMFSVLGVGPAPGCNNIGPLLGADGKHILRNLREKDWERLVELDDRAAAQPASLCLEEVEWVHKLFDDPEIGVVGLALGQELSSGGTLPEWLKEERATDETIQRILELSREPFDEQGL